VAGELFTKPSFSLLFAGLLKVVAIGKEAEPWVLPLSLLFFAPWAHDARTRQPAPLKKICPNPLEKIKETFKNADLIIGKKKREVDHGHLDFRRGFCFFLQFGFFRPGL